MKFKSGELKIIIRYHKWYDYIIDFFKYFLKNEMVGTKLGEVRFDIYFDKNGRIVEFGTPVMFTPDGKIEFINKEIL